LNLKNAQEQKSSEFFRNIISISSHPLSISIITWSLPHHVPQRRRSVFLETDDYTFRRSAFSSAVCSCSLSSFRFPDCRPRKRLPSHNKRSRSEWPTTDVSLGPGPFPASQTGEKTFTAVTTGTRRDARPAFNLHLLPVTLSLSLSLRARGNLTSTNNSQENEINEVLGLCLESQLLLSQPLCHAALEQPDVPTVTAAIV